MRYGKIKEMIDRIMKYIVRASKSGYVEIEANSEEEALEKLGVQIITGKMMYMIWKL